MARGGRKTPGCFPKSSRFLFIHINRLVGDTYVHGVGGCVTGGSRAQVVRLSAEDKEIEMTHARQYLWE